MLKICFSYKIKVLLNVQIASLQIIVCVCVLKSVVKLETDILIFVISRFFFTCNSEELQDDSHFPD